MPSQPDRRRRGAELALRSVAVLALLAAILLPLLGLGKARRESADSAGLGHALARWSTVSSPASVLLNLASAPSGRDRDWLSALGAAGTAIQWRGNRLVPTAIALEPRADPAGGADLSISAPEHATAIVRDTVGALDSVPMQGGRAALALARPRSVVDAEVGPVVARAARSDSMALGHLLVLGRAGWEFKFTVAALEERGWLVDARAVVSPASRMDQHPPRAIDTARYSAVLVLDTTAAPWAGRIAGYVRSGGGLLLWGEAASLPALVAIAPGRSGVAIRSDEMAPPDSEPRSALGLMPITPLDSATVVLERRGPLVAVAARRIGAGRVIQTGYPDTWRWRMAGSDSALARHRDWLALLVARVAYARVVPVAAGPSDVAPLAGLIDALGPAASADSASADFAAIYPWLFGAIAGLLALEWASRRLRGAR